MYYLFILGATIYSRSGLCLQTASLTKSTFLQWEVECGTSYKLRTWVIIYFFIFTLFSWDVKEKENFALWHGPRSKTYSGYGQKLGFRILSDPNPQLWFDLKK